MVSDEGDVSAGDEGVASVAIAYVPVGMLREIG